MGSGDGSGAAQAARCRLVDLLDFRSTEGLRPSATMHTDPIAFFITWTCYGTWLPGDDRGWTKWRKGDQVAQPLLATWCRDQLRETPLTLDNDQRELVETTIEQHCVKRDWQLHAVNCRTSHCHVVVTAPEYDGEQVRDQLKAWCTRNLKSRELSLNLAGERRENWWTRKGSVRQLFDEKSLHAAITYTQDAQDNGGSHANKL